MSDDLKEVMIIDDDRPILQIAKELLKGSYYTYPLPSVEKMFEALRKVKPDLILLDINMPDMDGFEAISRLKADQRYADIPVIFATGSYAVEDAVKGFGLGAVDYITKPYRNPAFIECIDKHINPDENDVPLELDTENYDSFDKPIILTVDDSPDILKTVHAVLNDTYKVYTLPKPEKLREFLQKVEPDLFLLDYKMPVMSGLDLITVIREHTEHQKTPIVFLTSDGSLDVITAAIAMSACDYIVKPFKSDVLRDKVTKHIESKKNHE